MLKRALKSFFPRVFLKSVFSAYNKVKIATIDKILFPEYPVRLDQFLIYRKGYPFKENNISVEDITDDNVRSYMRNWFDWTQEEFILCFNKPCYIEPDQGWAIVSTNRLLYYSLGISRTWFMPKPSLLKFWNRKNVVSVPIAISLRDTGEENYFHFYNDVLTKLFFLRDNLIEVSKLPIIISKKLWDKPYFQYYLQHSRPFQSLHWLVQDKEYMWCQSAIFCKALTHRKDLLDQVFSPFYSKSDLSKRVFITRNKGYLRHIENSDEVEKLFVQYGFEVVDSGSLSLPQQMDAFSNASVIAGIHGAGLVNLAFRNGSCKVFEIFSYPEDGYLPFHYILLAKMKGFFYQAIIGEKNERRFAEGFYVDPVRLESSLKKWI